MTKRNISVLMLLGNCLALILYLNPICETLYFAISWISFDSAPVGWGEREIVLGLIFSGSTSRSCICQPNPEYDAVVVP